MHRARSRFMRRSGGPHRCRIPRLQTIFPALLFLVPLLLFATGAPAHPHEAEPPGWVVLDVRLPSPGAATRLEALGAVVDDVDGTRARVYASPGAWGAIEALGFPHTFVEAHPSAHKSGTGYLSYLDMTAQLEAYAAEYPELTRLYTLGQSVEGRELWALLISTEPEQPADKPAFKYVATMHGDERLGTDLCVFLIDRLLTDYGHDARITRLVEETFIWIVPLMNPDGMERGSRFNANGVDLNRAFPRYPQDFSGTVYEEGMPSLTGLQPEVEHIVAWTLEEHFVLSANFHTGALVVNYPYDHAPGVFTGFAAPTPDDALFRALSLRYASENPPMRASLRFPGGITNGSAWYSITGGMQDWNYRYAGCKEVTIELSVNKQPPPSAIPQFWADNEEAMLRYLEGVHLGVRGLVRDRHTEAPIHARITIQDNPQPVYSHPGVGNYHRLLLPGEYTLTAAAPGYIPFRFQATVPEGEVAVRADVALSNGDINGDGRIDAVDVQLVLNALLGKSDPEPADVDGLGVSATDLQIVINLALGEELP